MDKILEIELRLLRNLCSSSAFDISACKGILLKIQTLCQKQPNFAGETKCIDMYASMTDAKSPSEFPNLLFVCARTGMNTFLKGLLRTYAAKGTLKRILCEKTHDKFINRKRGKTFVSRHPNDDEDGEIDHIRYDAVEIACSSPMHRLTLLEYAMFLRRDQLTFTEVLEFIECFFETIEDIDIESHALNLNAESANLKSNLLARFLFIMGENKYRDSQGDMSTKVISSDYELKHVGLLLKYGCDPKFVDPRNNTGLTLMHLCVEYDLPDALSEIITAVVAACYDATDQFDQNEFNIVINSIDQENNWSPLMRCCLNGFRVDEALMRMDCLRQLVEAGANLEGPTFTRWDDDETYELTPLLATFEAANDLTQISIYLIEQGANFLSKFYRSSEEQEYDSLTLAIRNNNHLIVEAILKQSFHKTGETRAHPPKLRFLDLDERRGLRSSLGTPLIQAYWKFIAYQRDEETGEEASRATLQIMRLLIEAGTDIRPAMSACVYPGHITFGREVFKLLMEYASENKINSPRESRKSLLMEFSGQTIVGLSFFKMLLCKGAALDLRYLFRLCAGNHGGHRGVIFDALDEYRRNFEIVDGTMRYLCPLCLLQIDDGTPLLCCTQADTECGIRICDTCMFFSSTSADGNPGVTAEDFARRQADPVMVSWTVFASKHFDFITELRSKGWEESFDIFKEANISDSILLSKLSVEKMFYLLGLQDIRGF